MAGVGMRIPKTVHVPGTNYNAGIFKGIYCVMGLAAGPLNVPLLFHVVSSQQSDRDGNLTELLYMIPENWLDTDWKHFVYPAPHFHVNGLYPWDWNLINFKKRRFPEMTFVEYEIMDIVTECGSVTFEAATEEIRKIKDSLGISRNLGRDNEAESNLFNWSTQQLNSPAGSLTSLDAGNLGKNTSFAASTPLSNFSPAVKKVHSGSRPFPSKHSVAKKHGVHPSPSTRSLNRSRSSSVGESKTPRTSSDVFSCSGSLSPLSEVAGGSSEMAGGTRKTNSLSVRDAIWKLKPKDARSKKPSSYPTTPVVAGIRKAGSSRSAEASSSKQINQLITPAVARTSEANNDPETLAVAVVEGASKSTKHAEACTADIAADKYVWRQEMLKQTLATNALLKDLIPPKRLITKVLQTYLEQFTTTVENTLSLPLNQIDDVSLLNTALLDMQLSVSLSAVQIDKLRLLTTENVIAKSLLANLMCGQICHKMQWKRRGKDLRPGIGHLVNLIAVFGVVTVAIFEQQKKQTNTSKIISAIQAARRYHAHQFMKYLNDQQNPDEEDNGGEVASQRVDAQIKCTIEARVNAVLRCLEDYPGSI